MSKPNIYDLQFSKRMEELMKKHGGSIASFAQKLEVTPPTVTRWIKGEADPSRTNLIKIAEATNVSVQWLATGEGENQSSKSVTQTKFEELEQDNSVSMIDSYESISVSAGFGSFNEGVTEPDGQEPYSDNLIASLGVKARHCAVFWADGDSMYPTIENGDQLLVDLSRKDVKGDRIYLVQNGDSVWVKRVKMKWDCIELISDNKDEYPPIVISREEAEYLQIIGQVVHIGHSLI